MRFRLGLLFCAFAISAKATSLEKYISATGPFGNGDTHGAPLDASGTNFVATMNSIGENYTIRIAPGTYQCNSDIVPKKGWTVLGAGKDQTKIVRTNVSSGATASVFNNISDPAKDDNSYYFANMTIDLSGGGIATIPASCSMNAIRVNCLWAAIEGVRIIEPKHTLTTGSPPTLSEGFPVSLSNATRTNAYGRIYGCEISLNNSGSYLTAFFAGGMGSGNLSGEMSGNKVTISSTSSNSVIGFGVGAVHDFRIENNVTTSVSLGIELVFSPSTGVSIVGNTLLDCISGGVSAGGASADSVKRLTLRDNLITTRSNGLIFRGNISDAVVSNNVVATSPGYTASTGIDITNYLGANSNFILSGNQISSSLSNTVASGSTSLVVNNQTGSAIAGNYFTSFDLTQPSNAPVAVDTSSLTLAQAGVARLAVKSTTSNDAQLWLTSDGKSMVWAKVNNANGNQLRLYYDGGSGLTGPLATFGTDGALSADNLRWNAGIPEGSVSASAGTIYANTSGGPGGSLYIKEAGTATTTGWKKLLSESNLNTTSVTLGSAVTVAGNSAQDIATLTVPNASLGDVVMIGVPSTAPAALAYSGLVSATGFVKIRALNPASGNQFSPVGTYTVRVLK